MEIDLKKVRQLRDKNAVSLMLIGEVSKKTGETARVARIRWEV